MTARGLPVTCGGCVEYDGTTGLCLHSAIEAAREEAQILGAVGDGKAAPPDWCPLRTTPEPASALESACAWLDAKGEIQGGYRTDGRGAEAQPPWSRYILDTARALGWTPPAER